jgi:hypothetical protein
LRSATAEAGRLRSEENVPSSRSTFVAADQRVVVGDDRVLVALVVLDHHLDLAAVDEPALLVDHRLPDLVALLGGLSGLRELAGQREGGPHLDRLAPGTSASTAIIVIVAAAGHREYGHGQQREN